MPVEEISCESWNKFKGDALAALFGTALPNRGRFCFRGHGDSEWRLISSFDRWYQTTDRTMAKKEATERCLALFREEANRFSSDTGIALLDTEVLGLAQHYGAPTRLLDWTESPYIAAFFAFSEIEASPQRNSKVAIWCLDRNHKIWGDEVGIKLLGASCSPVERVRNERLRIQLGLFTFMESPFDCLEEHLAKCDETGTALRKILLPASEAHTALRDLDLMGINWAGIYPGWEGCARAAWLRFSLGH